MRVFTLTQEGCVCLSVYSSICCVLCRKKKDNWVKREHIYYLEMSENDRFAIAKLLAHLIQTHTTTRETQNIKPDAFLLTITAQSHL